MMAACPGKTAVERFHSSLNRPFSLTSNSPTLTRNSPITDTERAQPHLGYRKRHSRPWIPKEAAKLLSGKKGLYLLNLRGRPLTAKSTGASPNVTILKLLKSTSIDKVDGLTDRFVD